MPVTLGAKPEHDFHQPLGLLSDCHRRIENFLGILLRVSSIAYGRKLEPAELQAVEVALRYFETAAPRHTDDEESSLFPRMRKSSDPRVREAMAKIDALEADHHAAAGEHREVELLARRWIEQGSLAATDASRLSERLRKLRDLYQRHIEVEDHEIFPLAAGVLSPHEIAAVGREMASRRGLQVS